MVFSINRFAQLLAVLVGLASLVNAIDTITIKGRHFVNSRTGEIVLLHCL
jgi:predicted lysophospholipase L1 biosynthesis ABC-type transport system permease subunit